MPKPQPPPESYRKNCTLCNKPRDVLVRCQIDPNTPIPTPASASASPSSKRPDEPDEPEESNPNLSPPTTSLKPGAWHFVCPGSCWQRVSGGVVDGDLAEGRQGYRYGGMWKNKHAGVSAKVPRRLKGKLGRDGGRKDEGEEEEGGEEEEREEERKGGVES